MVKSYEIEQGAMNGCGSRQHVVRTIPSLLNEWEISSLPTNIQLRYSEQVHKPIL